MSKWQKVKIGNLLQRSKITIDIEDSNIYNRVTIRTKHQGISLRDEEIGKKIGTKKQFVLKAGQFLMSKIDARYGAFGIAGTDVDDAIITGNFWAYDINKNLTTVEWINNYTNSPGFYDLCERASSGITHRKYLDEKMFLNHELFIPIIEKQQQILSSLSTRKKYAFSITNEINAQKIYLTKLRQAILQEAIEGKLTADWRVKKPVCLGDPNTDAAALLATIKAEKQKLISDGKIKKEKPLAPINPDDVPFALPDGWVWVRLGEITLYSEAGKSFLCTEREIDDEEWGVVKVSSVSWGEFRERENKLYSKAEPENIKYKINVGDFLISRANTTDLVGRSVIVRELSRNLLLSDKIIRFVFSFEIIKEFSNRFNTSIYARNHFEGRATGSSPSMKNVNRSDMELLVIPLPPLAEQNAIVERVDRLLNHVNALEQQVTERKSHAEQLMQAVLKEAFSA